MIYLKSVDKVKEFLLELFFPSFCLGCNTEGVFLCEDCVSTLEISEYTYCLCNKNPLRLPMQANPQNTIGAGKCTQCHHRKLSGLYFALPYHEKSLTRKLIHQFKYEPWLKGLAKPLAQILAQHFMLIQKSFNSIQNSHIDEFWENGILVPVPLEKRKLKNRGYNQSEELAKELSKILQVPVISNNLVKIKKTAPQMKLSKVEREKNLSGAFFVKNPEELKTQRIFLIDDVYTTGSTMEECAKVLKEAGAKQIYGITIAREG